MSAGYSEISDIGSNDPYGESRDLSERQQDYLKDAGPSQQRGFDKRVFLTSSDDYQESTPVGYPPPAPTTAGFSGSLVVIVSPNNSVTDISNYIGIATYVNGLLTGVSSPVGAGPAISGTFNNTNTVTAEGGVIAAIL